MNINDIYNFCFFLLNKNQSFEISDTAFNQACSFVSLDIFRKESGIPEDYQINNPTPRMAWQITSTISDDLRLLVKKQNIPRNSSGYFPFPDDYAAFSSMGYKWVVNNPTGNPTWEFVWSELVTDEEKRLRLKSTIKPPTAFYPITAYSLNGFEVYPTTIQVVELTYLKIPATPVRNFTQLPNDETEYNPVGSVQFEYPQTLYPNIAARVAMAMGISIREEDFIAYMNDHKEKGN